MDGEQHERQAEALLIAAGLVLVARNWRCRLGEIDLIMKDGATLVFVEVRKRGSERFGGAIASIGAQKTGEASARHWALPKHAADHAVMSG